jgi:hypothetical protein
MSFNIQWQLLECLDKLDLEIAIATAKIEEEKADLKSLYEASGGNSSDRIASLEKSLDRLSTKEDKLIDSRNTLQLALTNQPAQGTSTLCRYDKSLIDFLEHLCREGGRRDFGKEQRARRPPLPCSLSSPLLPLLGLLSLLGLAVLTWRPLITSWRRKGLLRRRSPWLSLDFK